MDEAGAEIWIGKADFLPYKFTSNATVDMAKVKPNTTGLSGKTTSSISITASNFNKKFELTAPSDSVPIEELIAPIFMTSMQSPPNPAKPKIK